MPASIWLCSAQPLRKYYLLIVILKATCFKQNSFLPFIVKNPVRLWLLYPSLFWSNATACSKEWLFNTITDRQVRTETVLFFFLPSGAINHLLIPGDCHRQSLKAIFHDLKGIIFLQQTISNHSPCIPGTTRHFSYFQALRVHQVSCECSPKQRKWNCWLRYSLQARQSVVLGRKPWLLSFVSPFQFSQYLVGEIWF